MAQYTKINWSDSPNSKTTVTASRLNIMDNGIAAAAEESGRALQTATLNKNKIDTMDRTIANLTNVVNSEKVVRTYVNGKGYAYKFPSGLLICSITRNLEQGIQKEWNVISYWYIDPKDWTFAIPFVEAPSIIGSCNGWGGWLATDSSTPTQALGVSWYRASNTTLNVNKAVTVTAIGRWK